MKFIIEHLEPELFEWCFIEYGHISKIVGKNSLVFTNVENKLERDKLKKYGIVYDKRVSKLNFKNICVLSQYSKKTLTKNDKNKFECLVFGGILGDNPAKKRTNDITANLKKSKIKFDTRNLGRKQMPTDAAVYVAKEILEGRRLKDFRLVDEVDIEINENESITLPFRYPVDNNKAIISEKLVDYLKNRNEF